MLKNKIVLKRIAAVSASAMLIAAGQTAAFAAESTLGIHGTFSGNNAEIGYSAEDKGYGSFIYVFSGKLNKETPDIKTAIEEDKLVYAGICTGGKLNFTLPQEAPYGVYTVIIGSSELPSDTESRTEYIIRTDEEALSNALAVIRASKNAEELCLNLENYNEDLYIVDLESVKDDKELMFDILTMDGMESPEKLISSTLDIAEIKEADTEKIIKILSENKSLFGLGNNTDFDKNAEMTAGVFAALRSGGAKLDNVSEMRAAALEAVAVAAFNNADYSTVLEVLKKYNDDVFGVDFSSNNYKTADPYELKKALVADDYMNAKSVKEAFDNAVRTVKRVSGNSGNTGGTSGGTGGTGGGGRVTGGGNGGAIAPAITKPEEVDSLAGRTGAFNDLSGFDWAKEAIEQLANRKVVSGDGSGAFRPDDSVTREEFVKMVVEAFKIEKSEAEEHFKDVPVDAWYCSYVISALNNKIVSGISSELFGTGESITRQDAAVILQRAIDVCVISLEKEKTLINFTDYDDVSDYALTSVDSLARFGILNGFEDGSFRPFAPITRAEAAKVIYECIKNR